MRPKDLSYFRPDSSLRSASLRMSVSALRSRLTCYCSRKKTAGESPPTLTLIVVTRRFAASFSLRRRGNSPAGPASQSHPSPRSVVLLTNLVCESTSAEQGQPVWPGVSRFLVSREATSLSFRRLRWLSGSARRCSCPVIISYAETRRLLQFNRKIFRGEGSHGFQASIGSQESCGYTRTSGRIAGWLTTVAAGHRARPELPVHRTLPGQSCRDCTQAPAEGRPGPPLSADGRANYNIHNQRCWS